MIQKKHISLLRKSLAAFLLTTLLIVALGATAMATTYYGKNATAPNLVASWGINSGGGGANPANFTTAGDVFIIENGTTMTATAAWLIGAAGTTASTLQINNGGALAMGVNLLTLASCDFTNAGAFSSTTGGVTISGTLVTNSIDGFTTTGTVSMTKTGGTATLHGNVNGAAFTLSGLGGTLDLGAGFTHTFTGAWTRTNGALLGNSSTLIIGGTTTNTAGTFTAGTSTVNYNGGAAQTIANVTYNNLTLSGAGIKTTTGATVNGVLSMQGTATASAAPTYGGAATLQYNTATGRTVGAEWITPFAATGGVVIANTGAITTGVAKVFNAGVPLTINSGATLITNTFLLTLGGDFNNLGGTFTSTTGGVTIAGTAATQSISGFTTTGSVSCTKASGTATISSAVSAANLSKSAAGTLILGGSNTFSGTRTVSAGTLTLANTSALGAAGTALTLSGGTLDLMTDASVNAYNITVGGTAAISTDLATVGAGITHTLGTLSINASTLTIAGGSNVTSGTAGVTFSGTTTLSAASPTFTVNDPAGGGTTQLSVAAVSPGGRTATINGNGDVIQTGVWGATAGGITYSGTGTLTLNQINTFTGVLTVSNGTVIGTSAAGALGAGTVTLSGGVLKLMNASGANLSFGRATTVSGAAQIVSDVNASGAGNTYTLGTLSINASTLTIAGGSNVTSGTAGVTFSGTTTLSAASPTFAVNNPAGGGTTQLSVAAVAPGGFTATINGNGNVVQTGVWGPTAGGITYSGTGTLTLNQANTFTGLLRVNSGTVIGTANAGALGAGTLTLAGGILKLMNASGANLSFGRATTVSGAAQIVSDVTASGAGNTYTLGTLSIGAFTLTVTGGANVNSGVAGLTFGAFTRTNANAITVNDPAGGGTTQLSVAAISGNFLTTLGGSGDVVQTGVWSGTAASSLTYSGSGTLTLNQGNTSAGVLTVSGGTVIGTANAGALGAGTITLSGGILKLTNASGANLNFGRNTTVSGDVQIISDVTVASTAGNTYTLGTLTANAFTLTISGGANVNSGIAGITFGAVTKNGANGFNVADPVSGGATRLSVAAVGGNYLTTISGNGDVVQTGAWSGTSVNAITYNGTGTLTLSQANTYSGITTVNSGTLNINNATALGTGTFTITGGSIDNSSGLAVTLTSANPQNWNSDFTFLGSSALNLGTGAVTLSTDRQVTVNASTLTVGGSISDNTRSLTKAGAGTLSFGANAETLNNLTISAGTLISTSSTLNVAGTFSNSATFTHNNGAVNFNGSVAQAFPGTNSTNFYDLTLSNAAGTSLNNTITVSYNLAVNGGTFSDKGYQITGNAAGTLTLLASTELILGSAGTGTTFPTLFTNAHAALDVSSTVTYSSNFAQTVSGVPTYGNLAFSGNSTKSIGSATTANGGFTVSSPTVVNVGAITLTIKGSITNGGSIVNNGTILVGP